VKKATPAVACPTSFYFQKNIQLSKQKETGRVFLKKWFSFTTGSLPNSR